MKKEFLVGKVEATGEVMQEEGVLWDFLYYIVQDGGAYSIKVDRVGADGTLSEETAGLTDSYDEAEALVKKLMEGCAAPTCLDAVVDRIMG